MKKETLEFQITLDNQHMPESIQWKGSDNPQLQEAKSIMIALWDKKEGQTLRVDLWTKEMTIDEMKIFFHQNMVTLAQTYQRATGDRVTAEAVQEFLQDIGKKMGILR